MTAEGNNRAYRIVRFLARAYLAAWVAIIGVNLVAGPPSNAEVSFQTYPLVWVLTLLLYGVALINIPATAYFVHRDKQYLSRISEEVTTRSRIVLGVFQLLTGGFYIVYYARKRRQFVDELEEANYEYGNLIEEARSLLDRGATAAQQGEYDRAVDFAKQARETVSDAARQARRLDVDTGELEQLRTDTSSRLATWAAQHGETELDRAEQLAGEGRYDEAIDTATAVATETPSTAEGVDRQAVERLESLMQRARQHRLTWTVDLAEELLSEGEREADDGNYEAAVERAQRAADRLDREASDVGSGVDTGEMEATAARARQRQVDWETKRLEGRLGTARAAADRGAYDRAVDVAETVQSETKSVLREFSDAAVETDALDRLGNETARLRSEWERESFVERINDAKAVADERPEQARTALDSVLSGIDGRNTLSDRERTLLEEEARTAYLDVLTDSANTAADRGAELLDAGAYDRAIEAFRGAVADAEAGLESAGEWGVDDAGDIEAVRDRAETGFVETNVERIENRIRAGIEAFEAGNHDQARDTFDEAAEAATTAVDQLAAGGEQSDQAADGRARLEGLAEVATADSDVVSRVILGIEDETVDLREPGDVDGRGGPRRAGDRADATNATATPGGPPAEIPVASDLDVAYGDVSTGDRIGRGGSADVFEATVGADGREYRGALKKPRGDSGETITGKTMDRFVSEAETWAHLDDHDFVVGVMGWGRTPVPWILMEYMDGGDLGEYAGSLPIDRAIWTARCVTEGVIHAHSRGVAHLDLKPENILFRTVEEGWSVPKIADWGLAETMLGDSGGISGMTPQYAAPEQIDSDRFGDPDQPTDIYQLGAVFYELFVGHPPFAGEGDVTAAIVENDVVPPSEADPDLPTALDDVLLRALAREKTDRYEAAHYFRDALADLDAVAETRTST